jgi:hypothetical protein
MTRSEMAPIPDPAGGVDPDAGRAAAPRHHPQRDRRQAAGEGEGTGEGKGAEEVKGIDLAAAWVTRILAWALLVYGVGLMAFSASIAWQYRSQRADSLYAVFPLVAGAVLVVGGRYLHRRAVADIRRARPVARGFDVIGPKPHP